MPRKKNNLRIKRGIKAYKRGKNGETLAALWLRLKGYRILARRWNCSGGEIDIIARKGKIIVLVEIKTRPDIKQAMEAISRKQQQRIENSADIWLARFPAYAQYSLRFDFIAVCPRKLPHHIKAYWTV